MKELYIFDFDGTLVDSIVDSIACVNEVLKRFDKPTYDKDLKTLYYKDFRQFLKDIDAGKETDVYPAYIDLYKDYPKVHTRPYDGVKEVLEELSNRGKTLAICSNRDVKYLNEFSKEIFKDINFKYISGYRKGIPDKPNPYRLNEIVEMEGCSKDEVLYFGDKDADIAAAENASMDMVLVTYGQGNDEDYSSDYPLRIIDSPYDILDLDF